MPASILQNIAQRWSRLEQSLLPAKVWEADSLTIWRERILLVLSLMAAGLGLLALAPSLVLAYVEQRWAVMVIDCVAYLAVLAVFLGRRRSLQVRAWIIYLVVYGLGLGLMIMLGPHGAGYIWLFAASVMAGALLGLRPALVTLVINLASLLLVAVLLHQGHLPWSAGMTNPLEVWLVMVTNFMLLNALVTVTTALMLGGLKGALEKEVEASLSLRQSEARFRDLSENAPDIIFALDPDGRFSYVNPGMAAILGYAPAELAGRALVDLAPPDQAAPLRTALAAAAGGGRTVHGVETRLVHRDGRSLRFLLGGAPHGGEPGGPYGMIGVLKDVTEQAQLAHQLQQAQKMEALGVLAGGIAHDFNNILSVVMGYTELAQELSGQGRPNRAELDQVLQASLRARNLVKQILTFSRKAEADLKPLDLNQAVRAALAILRRTLPKMIAIEDRLAPDAPLVRADANQIEQVLLNLANNAADAMPDGGRLVFETQAVNLDQGFSSRHGDVRPGRYVLLAVSDTGRGMDPATLDRVFDPFFTTKAVGKGTGLGLATVYGIVKGHGGQVYCYSEPGQGSSFKIFLPEAQAGPDAAAGGAEPSLRELGGSETILLVDDEQALRDLGALSLREAGYTVLTASDGETALAAYEERAAEIDLVLMDLGMPGMGGRKTCQAILAMDPAAKVLITSGYAAHNQVRDSLEAGAAGYVAKPFQRRDLLAAVRRVLDGR
ncbi:MAG: response regulator [Pseudomonadota bacterium]